MRMYGVNLHDLRGQPLRTLRAVGLAGVDFGVINPAPDNYYSGFPYWYAPASVVGGAENPPFISFGGDAIVFAPAKQVRSDGKPDGWNEDAWDGRYVTQPASWGWNDGTASFAVFNGFYNDGPRVGINNYQMYVPDVPDNSGWRNGVQPKIIVFGIKNGPTNRIDVPYVLYQGNYIPVISKAQNTYWNTSNPVFQPGFLTVLLMAAGGVYSAWANGGANAAAVASQVPYNPVEAASWGAGAGSSAVTVAPVLDVSAPIDAPVAESFPVAPQSPAITSPLPDVPGIPPIASDYPAQSFLPGGGAPNIAPPDVSVPSVPDVSAPSLPDLPPQDIAVPTPPEMPTFPEPTLADVPISVPDLPNVASLPVTAGTGVTLTEAVRAVTSLVPVVGAIRAITGGSASRTNPVQVIRNPDGSYTVLGPNGSTTVPASAGGPASATVAKVLAVGAAVVFAALVFAKRRK